MGKDTGQVVDHEPTHQLQILPKDLAAQLCNKKLFLLCKTRRFLKLTPFLPLTTLFPLAPFVTLTTFFPLAPFITLATFVTLTTFPP